MRMLVLGLAALVPSLASAADVPARPNVLWITWEDSSPLMGCYGDPLAITPNLDRVAARGVRYTHAFSVAGVCAPSRSCLITGVYPSSLGTQHMRCTGTLPPEVVCFTEHLRKAGYYCSNNAKTDYNFSLPKSAWDESSNKAHWRNRTKGQPFFSVFNNLVTHESQIRTPEAVFVRQTAALTPMERHDPAKMAVPPFHPDTPAVRRDWARYYDLYTAMDKQTGALLKQLEDDGLAEDTIVFFYADHGVGLPRGKRWLYDTGMRVPLIVYFPPKYRGLSPVEPGKATDRLVSFVDFGPTVLSLAGVKVPAVIQGVPFLGAQAGPPREAVYGIRDRMDERTDFTRAVRDKRYKYIRNYLPHLPWAAEIDYMNEMPTMKEYRRLAAEGKLSPTAALFMRPTKPFEELYDTEADPHEVKDLATDPAHHETLERLRNLHLTWMRETKDLGLLPEAEIHLRSAGKPPYLMARTPGAYPLDRILTAATRPHSNGDPLSDLMLGLKDPDAAVRTWSVIHLGVRGDKSADVVAPLRGLLKDPSPCVRVAAADALGRMGMSADALPVLAAELKHDNEWVRLSAAEALDRLGESAAPVRDAMRAASKDSNQYVQRVVKHAGGN